MVELDFGINECANKVSFTRYTFKVFILMSEELINSKQLKQNKVRFNWQDPLLLESLLTEEERMIRDSAHQYCQEKLMPRILSANRHEHFDVNIMKELR